MRNVALDLGASGISIWASTLHRDVLGVRSGRGNRSALLAQFIQIECDHLADIPVHLLSRAANAHTTWRSGT